MTALRQRHPREEEPGYLAFLRGKPCCVCGRPPRSQAAHIRMACPERGKRSTGIGEKPDDRWAVPLCADCHLNDEAAQHGRGERKWWAHQGLDPFAIAERCYAEYRAQKPAEKARKVRVTSFRRTEVRRPKRKWPKRKIQNARRWPKRKLRGGARWK